MWEPSIFFLFLCCDDRCQRILVVPSALPAEPSRNAERTLRSVRDGPGGCRRHFPRRIRPFSRTSEGMFWMKGKKKKQKILIINLVSDFLTRRRCGRSTVLFFFCNRKLIFFLFLSVTWLATVETETVTTRFFSSYKLMAYFSLSFSLPLNSRTVQKRCIPSIMTPSWRAWKPWRFLPTGPRPSNILNYNKVS